MGKEQYKRGDWRLIPSVDDLYNLINEIQDNVLRRWTSTIIHRIEKDFITKPGSAKHHHAWRSGLLQHTYSVAQLAGKIAQHYINDGLTINKDVVISGAILQDIGKIYCYEEIPDSLAIVAPPDREPFLDRQYRSTRHDAWFHHIPLGFSLARAVADELHCTDNENVLHALHIIISHHGKKEWSSPQEPKTLEALIGHHADFIDSCVFATEETQKLKLGGKTY